MDERVAARLAESERRREAFVARVLSLAPEARTLRRGGSLSPAECVGHLAKTEALYAPMVRPGDAPARPNALYRWLLARFRRGAKMPTAPMLVPRAVDLAADAEAWARGRADLLGSLEKARPGLRAARHPLFGALGPEDLLALFDAHIEYHERRAFAESA